MQDNQAPRFSWLAHLRSQNPVPNAQFRTLTRDLHSISGPNSLNVPICPVLPFATRLASRNYADGQSEPGPNCSQTASVLLRKGARQCRAKHCVERPVPDRGQALGVFFCARHEARINRASRPLAIAGSIISAAVSCPTRF